MHIARGNSREYASRVLRDNGEPLLDGQGFSREEIQQLIENHNGIFAKSVTKKLDYLVLGGIQNPAWKFGQYGTKYNKAREYQEKGVPISIITEEEFLKLFEGE